MSRLVSFAILLAVCFSACTTGSDNPNKDIALEAFDGFRNDDFFIDADSISANIDAMMRADGVMMPSDRFVRAYYGERKPFMWINHDGVTACADTLLEYIVNADREGISRHLFRLEQIREDLETVRAHGFSGGKKSVNFVLARIEYNLMRSYMRYLSGQHFGFLNPNNLYNKLDTLSNDSTGLKWKRLCDLHVKRPDSSFYVRSINNINTDSIGPYMSSAGPRGRLYDQLVAHLNSGTLTAGERMKTLCNIERCRWRLDVMPEGCRKYVQVNIPSYNLRAIDGDSVLTMRICCGARKTKTPLLSSRIMRMDVNPQWIVPKSIAVGYVGRTGYMRSQGMFVYDRKRGKLPPEEVSYTKVSQGEQYIIQEGGPKNSLGRIIFRFDNNFSVFLHDTSAPWLFKAEKRAVSHGCIRVERPYDLAVFMLGSKSGDKAERIKYTMTMDMGDKHDGRSNIDKSKVVNSVKVEPQIPLFITYYTIYHGNGTGLVSYEDVYGLDDVTIEQLRPYIRL